MKKRKYIGRLLLLVSMLVLIVPVLPHHHHLHSICVAHDENKPHTHHGGDSGCGSTCITKLHFSVQHHNDDCIQPQTFDLLPILAEVCFNSLLLPEQTIAKQHFVYIERLHSSRILPAVGLRAPPLFCLKQLG